ncbi:MAG: Ribosomal protein S16, mitochondrial [Sarea resinae]|nr:MAG: Ribosomal protein S16, mitochondrial [Sarea resinae]
MVLKIRLARFGKRNAPFYNIVVAHARTARNSKPIEVLGTYDPIPKPTADGEGKPFKDIRLDSVRAKYWLGVGAQPSDPAWRLLSMAGLPIPRFGVLAASFREPTNAFPDRPVRAQISTRRQAT